MGLAVYTGHDEGGSVVLLRGPHRLELAVIDAAGLASWTTAAKDELRALRLGASILSDCGDVEITAVKMDPVAVPGDSVVLDRHADIHLGWATLVDGQWCEGTAMPPAAASAVEPDPALIADLTAAVAAATVDRRTPDVAPPNQAKALRRIARPIKTPVSNAEVVAFRQPTEDLVMLDGRGLVARRVFGRSLSETVGEWGHPTGIDP